MLLFIGSWEGEGNDLRPLRRSLIHVQSDMLGECPANAAPVYPDQSGLQTASTHVSLS